MDTMIFTQTIGWIASLCAVCSYCFKNVRSVRIVNCIAAGFFIAYGLMLDAPAIIIGNATLAIVHLSYLLSHDQVGTWIESHLKTTFSIFAVYAIVCIMWTCISTNMNVTEIIGTVSFVGFVGGFLIPKEIPMRSVCSIALIGNIIYAILLVSPQVGLTNTVSLIANIVRLVQVVRQKTKR